METKMEEKTEGKKFKLSIILILCVVLLISIFTILQCNRIHNHNKILERNVNDITEQFEKGNYAKALDQIAHYKELYLGDSTKYDSEVNNLVNEIEDGLYNSIIQENSIEYCKCYIEYYPSGKYLSNVKNKLVEISENNAIEDIKTARTEIKNQEYSSAYYSLDSIINNNYVSEDTQAQAKKLIETVEPYYYILGTWTKQTGVSYTFENDGHMSVSMSQNYDNSVGTLLDGLEVNSIIKEINTFSRIVRGGRWEFSEKLIEEGRTFYQYSLFYDSSLHTCILEEGSNRLGIQLNSGYGDMSILTK